MTYIKRLRLLLMVALKSYLLGFYFVHRDYLLKPWILHRLCTRCWAMSYHCHQPAHLQWPELILRLGQARAGQSWWKAAHKGPPECWTFVRWQPSRTCQSWRVRVAVLLQWGRPWEGEVFLVGCNFDQPICFHHVSTSADSIANVLCSVWFCFNTPYAQKPFYWWH